VGWENESYVDIVFSEASLNDEPKNFLLLASHLAVAVFDCEKWWADISFAVQKIRFLAGTAGPWGMMLHVTSYGKSEEEARKSWVHSLVAYRQECA
jgi:hypothetical protein